jgi:hypothetical protein
MTKFIPGTVVKMTNLSRSSYFLYKKYLQVSPLLVCPCKIKRDVLLVIREVFDNGIALLQVKNNTRLTMVYINDLEAVYEPELND